MLETIKLWIVTILVGAFIVNIVDMILPDSKLKPYINVVMNFIFVFIVITPIINYFLKSNSLEDTVLIYMNEYNKEYVDSMNELYDETGNSDMSTNYESGLKEVLKLKLDEYGYELDDIEFEGNGIDKITVSEKNGNNVSDEDIQSIESENSEEVFFSEEEYNINFNEEELKDDLTKILDISIETIEID